jgi:hypothetical protein
MSQRFKSIYNLAREITWQHDTRDSRRHHKWPPFMMTITESGRVLPHPSACSPRDTSTDIRGRWLGWLWCAGSSIWGSREGGSSPDGHASIMAVSVGEPSAWSWTIGHRSCRRGRWAVRWWGGACSDGSGAGSWPERTIDSEVLPRRTQTVAWLGQGL